MRPMDLSRHSPSTFSLSRFAIMVVYAKCLQLYNDELIDLLSSNRSSDIRIQENPDTGEIVIRNATTIPVSNSNELLDALRTGARGRTTASTKVNEQSSRSHAIFSIYIKQQKLEVISRSPHLFVRLNLRPSAAIKYWLLCQPSYTLSIWQDQNAWKRQVPLVTESRKGFT